MTNVPARLPTLLQRLLGLMAGPDFELRRSAVMALSRLRGQVAAEIVFDRFQSDNLEDYLVFAMKTMDPERTGKLLVNALNDPHLEVRLRAAEALAAHPTEESVFALTQAVEAYLNRNKLTDQGQSVLVTEEGLLGAARALGEIGTPMCMGLLRKMVLQETNARIRATAVAALCLKPTDSLMPILQGLLKDPDARVRANVIEGIQRLDKASAIGLLQPYLYDVHQRVRANAAKAIWKFGDYEVTSTIREMLAHPDKKQVVSAIYAIGETRITAFTRNLTGYLNNPDADIRRNAVIALRKFGKAETAPDFRSMLNDPIPAVRIQAAGALAEVVPDQAAPAILARLHHEPEAQVRAALLDLLGRVGGEACHKGLPPFLKDSDERVVLAALETMARLVPHDPPPTFVMAVDPLQKSKDLPVRRRAISLLWRWGFLEVLGPLAEHLAASGSDVQSAALQTTGDIFAAVSETGGEMLAIFDQCLWQIIEEFRHAMHQATTAVVEQQLTDLLAKAQEAFKDKRLPDALTLLDQALAIAPTNLAALVGRGEVCLAANDLPGAEAALTKALAIDPNSVKAQFCLGQVRHRKGEWERALEPLLTTIRLYPKLPQAYLMLADAQESLGRFAEARDTLRTLTGMAAPNPVLQQRFARLCFLAGGVAESIQLLRSFAGKSGLDLGTQIILAVSDAMDGQALRASRTFLRLTTAVLDARVGKPPAYLSRLLQIASDVLARLPDPTGARPGGNGS